jgi:hypothetical protein
MIARRGVRFTEDHLLKCLNGDQYGRYKAISRRGGPDNDQEQNFVGWIAGRIGVG